MANIIPIDSRKKEKVAEDTAVTQRVAHPTSIIKLTAADDCSPFSARTDINLFAKDSANPMTDNVETQAASLTQPPNKLTNQPLSLPYSQALGQAGTRADLVVFGEDWGGLPSSTQHLIARLSQHYRVFWVNSIGLRQPQWHRRDGYRIVQKLLAAISKGRRGDNGSGSNKANATNETHGTSNQASTLNAANVDGKHSDYCPIIIKPLTIPAPQGRLARLLANWLLLQQIKPVLTRFKVVNPLVWTSLPTAVDICQALNPERIVYYCGDDFSALAGVDHHTVSGDEERLVAKAQLILAASPALAKKFPHAKTELMPHGVDVSLFRTASLRAPDLLKDGKPIAGFYGSLSSWLDYQLLFQVASHLPDWHFVFIGNIETEVGALMALPNVRFLGARRHEELPSYSQHWQVSLLPFRNTPQIQACNPLKLLEYIACGRPIVSTEFPAAQQWPEQVHLVYNAGDMIRTLQQLRQSLRVASQVDLSQHSWEARATSLHHLLEQI